MNELIINKILDNQKQPIIGDQRLIVSPEPLPMEVIEANINKIMPLEEALKNHPNTMPPPPLDHIFAPGVYIRKIFLPEGMALTGRIHRHEYINILLEGECEISFNGEVYVKSQGATWVSPPGIKRAIMVKKPTIWLTVHANPTNETDLEELFTMFTAGDYQDFVNGDTETLLLEEKI